MYQRVLPLLLTAVNPVICRNSIFSATRRLRSWKQMCKKACRILWV